MVPILEFQQTQITAKPLWYFDSNNREGELKRIWQYLKNATGYIYDSDSKVWSNIYGQWVAFSIHYSGKSFVISVWDVGGHIALGTIIQPCLEKEKDVLTPQNYNRLEEISINWHEGKVECSSCKSKQHYQHIKRQSIFAGVYCDECWQKTYAKKASTMTYD